MNSFLGFRYQSVPRLAIMRSELHLARNKQTISQYFGSNCCLLCAEAIGRYGICERCLSNRQNTSFTLSSMIRFKQKDYCDLLKLCASCTGSVVLSSDCVSMDCPVLYRRTRALHNLQSVSTINDILVIL